LIETKVKDRLERTSVQQLKSRYESKRNRLSRLELRISSGFTRGDLIQTIVWIRLKPHRFLWFAGLYVGAYAFEAGLGSSSRTGEDVAPEQFLGMFRDWRHS
jgi:hypothetical protein